RLDVGHAALVDVPEARPDRVALDVVLLEDAPLDDRHPDLLRLAGVDQHLAGHSGSRRSGPGPCASAPEAPRNHDRSDARSWSGSNETPEAGGWVQPHEGA